MNMPRSTVEFLLKNIDLQFFSMFLETKIRFAIFLHVFQNQNQIYIFLYVFLKLKLDLHFIYKILSVFYL